MADEIHAARQVRSWIHDMAWGIYSIYNPGRILLDKGCRTHLWKTKNTAAFGRSQLHQMEGTRARTGRDLEGKLVTVPEEKDVVFQFLSGKFPKFLLVDSPPKKEQDVVLRVGLCHLGVVYFLKIRATKLGSERPEVPNTIIPKPLKFQRIYGFLSTKNWGVNHWKIAVALLHLFHGSMVFKSKYTYVLHIHI